MTDEEIVGALRKLIRETRTLQRHLRHFIQLDRVQVVVSANAVEGVISQLEELACRLEKLVRLAEQGVRCARLHRPAKGKD